MTVEIVVSSPASPDQLMSRDAELLERVREHPSVLLHHYEWKGDSATFGYFVDPYHYLCREAVEKRGLALARRPTGGGILFHLWDLAFSVVIPASHTAYSANTMTNYATINSRVAMAIGRFSGVKHLPSMLQQQPEASSSQRHFCFAAPTKYDLLLEGRKVAGAAQRRTRWGYLHQGSISLLSPDPNYLRAVVSDEEVSSAMMSQHYPLLGETSSAKELALARQELRALLESVICETL